MVTVVDALMGAGKTSWAIQHINENEDNILYVTPYLDECQRIMHSCNRDIKQPMYGRGGETKRESLISLFENKDDISSTHALFRRLDKSVTDIIKQGEYTLYLDEVLSAIEPYNTGHKDNIKLMLERGIIRKNPNGMVEWLAGDMDTDFNDVKTLAQNNCLFYVNDKLLMWRYPPEVFRAFKHIYVMTFMFDASILRYYFDICGIEYEKKTIAKEETEARTIYSLVPYYKPDLSQVRRLITVCDNPKLNMCVPQKQTSLSVSWFRNPNNSENVTKLKNSIYNYFRYEARTSAEKRLWTTFVDYQHKLQGKGYSKRFLAHNARSSNDYAETDTLVYCLNKYVDTGTKDYLNQKGQQFDEDAYALSEMIQWIWRSQIRNGKPINIFVPSKRMRRLLNDWLYQ